MAEDLRRYLDGRPILARPITRGERVWMWAKRNPVVASLSALCGLLAVALGGDDSVSRLRVAAAFYAGRRTDD